MTPDEIKWEAEVSRHFLAHIRAERDRLMDRINEIDRLEVNEVLMRDKGEREVER